MSGEKKDEGKGSKWAKIEVSAKLGRSSKKGAAVSYKKRINDSKKGKARRGRGGLYGKKRGWLTNEQGEEGGSV